MLEPHVLEKLNQEYRSATLRAMRTPFYVLSVLEGSVVVAKERKFQAPIKHHVDWNFVRRGFELLSSLVQLPAPRE